MLEAQRHFSSYNLKNRPTSPTILFHALFIKKKINTSIPLILPAFHICIGRRQIKHYRETLGNKSVIARYSAEPMSSSEEEIIIGFAKVC